MDRQSNLISRFPFDDRLSAWRTKFVGKYFPFFPPHLFLEISGSGLETGLDFLYSDTKVKQRKFENLIRQFSWKRDK